MQIPRKLFISVAILLAISAVIFVFGLSPTLVLYYYSTGLYPIISVCLRWISSIFPYALGDILYFSLIIFALRKIFLFVKKRKSLTKADRFIIPLKTLN